MREVSRAFRAMNTDVLVVAAVASGRGDAAAKAMDRVQARFAEVEAALSRFRPDSELSALNRSAGRPFLASPLLFEVVDQAIEAARDSGGVFGPTVLGALVKAGYDRSFELLDAAYVARGAQPAAGGRRPPPDDSSGRSAARSGTVGCSWQDVRLDRDGRTIKLPEGCGIDLGGIGKGWMVDRAVELLGDFASFAVDAGGDLYARGLQADGAPWTVGVDDPREPGRDLTVLTVRDRAVATSTVARRRWVRDGQAKHHLIDPRTGLPGASGVLSATVVAGSVARAEVLAKVSLLLGPETGLAFLDARPDAAGLLALADGRVELSGRMREVQNEAKAAS